MNDSLVVESQIKETMEWYHKWTIPREKALNYIDNLYEPDSHPLIISSRLHKLWPDMYVEMRFILEMENDDERDSVYMVVELANINSKIKKICISIRFSIENMDLTRTTKYADIIFTPNNYKSDWIRIGKCSTVIRHCETLKQDLIIRSEAKCKMECKLPINNHYRIYDCFTNIKLHFDNGDIIWAHRNILIENSFGFKSLLLEDSEHDSHVVIDVNENFQNFMFMIRYFYNRVREMDWNNINIFDVYQLGKKFEAYLFVKKCEEKIIETLNVDLVSTYIYRIVMGLVKSTLIEQEICKLFRDNKEEVMDSLTWKSWAVMYKAEFDLYKYSLNKIAFCDLDKNVIIKNVSLDEDSDFDDIGGNRDEVNRPDIDVPTIIISNPKP